MVPHEPILPYLNINIHAAGTDKPGLRIRINLLRIRILLFTLRIRTYFSLLMMQIRILPFNLMLIRIQILPLTFSHIWNLQCSIMTRIRFLLFTLMRIRIQLKLNNADSLGSGSQHRDELQQKSLRCQTLTLHQEQLRPTAGFPNLDPSLDWKCLLQKLHLPCNQKYEDTDSTVRYLLLFYVCCRSCICPASRTKHENTDSTVR